MKEISNFYSKIYPYKLVFKFLDARHFRNAFHLGSTAMLLIQRQVFLLILLVFLSCSNGKDAKGNKEDNTLNIATAANVQFAMKAIELAYEQKFNTNINVILGSSGKLTAQIMQGAPYDLFISANEKYPEKLFQEGFALTAPKIYSFGKLVLWTMHENLDLDERLNILTNPNIIKIAIANPKNAPYGEQALQAFDYFLMSKKVQSKLVFGENIAQTNQYILSKNCEIGITAKSVVTAPELKGKGKWLEISTAAYTPISQAVIITKKGAKNKQAKKFYDFLFSKEARQIFVNYGYSLPLDNG